MNHFRWQNGYAALSVCQSHRKRLAAYIEGQEEHHQHQSFKDELRTILKTHEVPFDEKYIWDQGWVSHKPPACAAFAWHKPPALKGWAVVLKTFQVLFLHNMLRGMRFQRWIWRGMRIRCWIIREIRMA